MANRTFTPEERAYLESLPAVAAVGDDTISYAPEFRNACMERYYAGESPAAIFREAGLDPAFIGYKRIERCIARWRGPKDPASSTSDTKVAAEQRDIRQQNRDLKTRVAALQGLVELADARNIHVVRKSLRFELIDRLHEEDPDFAISTACEELGVSVGGYYRWRNARGE